jgi:hypothetical protein
LNISFWTKIVSFCQSGQASATVVEPIEPLVCFIVAFFMVGWIDCIKAGKTQGWMNNLSK